MSKEIATLLRIELNKHQSDNITLYIVHAISEEHLREFSGGHGLFWPKEPCDREPVRGDVCGGGGRPVMEGKSVNHY